ncbi:MAG TPA: beta-glucosidase, partial [Chitinophagaceae bacterium]|nr:beta-glucosidase [Chitinophagaceae bacterium]
MSSINHKICSVRYAISLFLVLATAGCSSNKKTIGSDTTAIPSDQAIFDSVQKASFEYFWQGAEPNSGMARERIHLDNVYPQNDQSVVTSGGSGFGIMAILTGIERGFITRKQGLERLERIVHFL